MYLGLPGLATDVYTLHERLRLRVNMYTIKEEREITPVTCAHLVSSTLYKRRFGPYFMEPIVVVLEPIPMLGAAEAASAAEDGEEKAKRRFKPCIASTDLIGCISWPKDFAVFGTASEKLFGMAEELWEPDHSPENYLPDAPQRRRPERILGLGRNCGCHYVGQGDQVDAEGKDELRKERSGKETN